jgi:uncharacterized membrane protein
MLNPVPPNSNTFPLADKSTFPRLAGITRAPYVIALVGGLVLFTLAVLRHTFLRSGGYDLGIFDQTLYLISQGKTPVSSLIGIHIMADHVSLILYPLGWLYKLIPSVYLLFALQTFAITSGVIPLYYLARHSNLGKNAAIGLSIAYLLYPVTIFASLFDFNPQTVAVPFLLGSIFFARTRRLLPFIACIAMVLACRDANGLIISALGVWLLGFEKRYREGAIALVGGIGWFMLSTKLIAPLFVTPGAISTMDLTIARNYGYLGRSFAEILRNLIFRPDIWIGHLLRPSVLKYMVGLLVPLAWGLSPRYLAPMIGAAPTLAMNLLAEPDNFRTLTYHYDLPILVFIFVTIIAAMAANKTWFKRGRTIVLWACLIILLGAGAKGATSNAKSSFNWPQYHASYAAIAQVKPHTTLLTTHSLAPHVSQRDVIHVYPLLDYYVPVFATIDSHKHLVAHDIDVSMYEQVLMRRDNSGSEEDRNCARLIAALQADPRFEPTYSNANVYLFTRRPHT